MSLQWPILSTCHSLRRKRSRVSSGTHGRSQPKVPQRSGVSSGTHGRSQPKVPQRSGESSASLPAGAFVRMRVRPRRQQGEHRDGDEVAERGLRPANFSSTVEPGRVDEEDDGRDHDLAEPANDEEQRRENDAPEAQLRKAHCGCKVEDVPSDPGRGGPDSHVESMTCQLADGPRQTDPPSLTVPRAA